MRSISAIHPIQLSTRRSTRPRPARRGGPAGPYGRAFRSDPTALSPAVRTALPGVPGGAARPPYPVVGGDGVTLS
ncbi:hypothetical protein FHX40_1904 [Thermopolyspora flexuosa]|uniref:Uncharacterized protein n=1 Tax=Thermopolyspora flexuosa TaxID=103836 RepID=A0A543IX99_9ACTN|nr:hypothetical protein FHX40_1904 [Thermopolyspora flexuosa]